MGLGQKTFLRRHSRVSTIRRVRGFTLVELMMTLAIAVILGTVAIPSMRSIINANRLASTTNDFVSSLSLARSEALKRGFNAVVCKSGGGTTCVTTGTWDNGWIVFADLDNSNSWSTGDVLIRRYDSLGSSTAITTSSNSIVYDRQGQATASATYTVCNSAVSKKKVVTVSTSGQHALTSGTC
ncbi:MAG: GspH/FimT family pseudopilin [Gammaproteobacteria bacterium]|nr:GspH/FimT family pseudopilin [Gammaproteobacteria bacterium]